MLTPLPLLVLLFAFSCCLCCMVAKHAEFNTSLP